MYMADWKTNDRRQGYETNQRMEKTFKDLNGKTMTTADKKQASLAERAKFQFEADSEDDEMENEIDSNLDALGGAAARLNGLARATGKEVDEQNRHLERINQKSSKVDDEVQLFLYPDLKVPSLLTSTIDCYE